MKVLKVNYKDIDKVLRFDGSYHLSEGVVYLKKLRNMPNTELQNLTSKIFTAGRNKRIYTQKEFGFPYLSNSDVSNLNPFSNCNYNSKKYAYDESSFLKEGMIVTGRVGAIGQSSYITTEFEDKKAMGSDNIIRIVTNDFDLSGYLYAFFASKYGTTLLWQLSTGGVQPYISEEMLYNLPIPKIEIEKQDEIHNLIFRSSKLRVEANNLLTKAHSFFEEFYENLTFRRTLSTSVSIDYIFSKNRFNSYFFLSNGEDIEKYTQNFDYELLSEITSNIFTSGREKRDYVDSIGKGKYFFNNTDLSKSNPYKSASIIRKSRIKEESKIKNNYLLTGRVGSVGEVYYPHNFIVGHLASDNVIRMEFKDRDQMNFTYAFLSSSYGREILIKRKSGTNQPFITENMLNDIQIPVFSKEITENIVEMINNFTVMTCSAFEYELKAIELLEKAIESWQ